MAKIDKVDGKDFLVWTDNSGSTIRKPLPNIFDIDKVFRSHRNPGIKIGATAYDYLEYFLLDRHNKDASASSRFVKKTVETFLRAKRIRSIDTLSDYKLEQWRDSLGQHRPPAAVNKRIGAIVTWLDWCLEHGCVLGNPARRVKPLAAKVRARALRYLTFQELWKVDQAAQGDFRTILRLKYLCGLPEAKIPGLTWEHLSGRKLLLEDALFFTTSEQITNATRYADAKTMESVRREMLKFLRSQEDGLVFPGWTSKSIKNHFRIAKALAGILRPDVRFQDLLHNFVTLFYEGGGDDRRIQPLTGLKLLTIGSNYHHVSDEHRARVFAKMDKDLEKWIDSF